MKEVNCPPDKGDARGFVPYNRSLTKRARENRKNLTEPEKRMWYQVLADRKMSGYIFFRQKPLFEFIVDFYCSELLLAVEIDGDSHAERRGYDDRRTKILESSGIRVVRYTNSDIMKNIEGVYLDLKQKVQKRKLQLELRKDNPL